MVGEMLAFLRRSFCAQFFLTRSCIRGCCSYENRPSHFFCGRTFRALFQSCGGRGNARTFVAPKPLFAHFSFSDLAIVDVVRMKIVPRIFVLRENVSRTFSKLWREGKCSHFCCAKAFVCAFFLKRSCNRGCCSYEHRRSHFGLRESVSRTFSKLWWEGTCSHFCCAKTFVCALFLTRSCNRGCSSHENRAAHFFLWDDVSRNFSKLWREGKCSHFYWRSRS